MDRPGLSVVRTDRISRLGHTAVGSDDRAAKLLLYRVLVGLTFAAIIAVVPIDIGLGTRLYVAGLAGVYVPVAGLVVYLSLDGDTADFANSISDIFVAGLSCVMIPGSSTVAAIAITAIVVVAIPVHSRRLVGVLAVFGIVLGGLLAYELSDSDDWYLQPLVMALLFPAFDLYFRDRRRQWEQAAVRYEALIQASEVFFWEIDLETGAFVTAVGNCEGLLGYRPSELVGMRWTDFVAEEDVGAVASIDHRLGRRSITTAMTCRNGQSRVFRHNVDRAPGGSIVFGVSADISELAQATEVIRHQAERDHLTGLSNRMVFVRHVDRALAKARRDAGTVLLVLDLNGFKQVNDTFGHHVGDVLLRELAGRLQSELPEAAVIARLGGDEFAVLIDECSDRATAVDVARRIQRSFQRPVDIGGFSLSVSSAIGIALLPEHATTTEEAVRRADLAMYESKRSGRAFVIHHDDPGQLALDLPVRGSEVETPGQPAPGSRPMQT